MGFKTPGFEKLRVKKFFVREERKKETLKKKKRKGTGVREYIDERQSQKEKEKAENERGGK